MRVRRRYDEPRPLRPLPTDYSRSFVHVPELSRPLGRDYTRARPQCQGRSLSGRACTQGVQYEPDPAGGWRSSGYCRHHQAQRAEPC